MRKLIIKGFIEHLNDKKTLTLRIMKDHQNRRKLLLLTYVIFTCFGKIFAQTPNGDLDKEAYAIVSTVLDKLDAAWNDGNGYEFANNFSEDADVINIFGGHFQGRTSIAERMNTIFQTIFKGSKHKERNLEMARHLTDDIILAVSSATVTVTSGPTAPETKNRQTLILTRTGDSWQITHWHNTTIKER
jgi:uncharacterized protein (TIGR02246 family)